ncbi:MAG: hypothetical protein M3222_03780, partial [Thermoproteota archaeon]|nr:hypothetical protein [Thermoproteota archaeon]
LYSLLLLLLLQQQQGNQQQDFSTLSRFFYRFIDCIQLQCEGASALICTLSAHQCKSPFFNASRT